MSISRYQLKQQLGATNEIIRLLREDISEKEERIEELLSILKAYKVPSVDAEQPRPTSPPPPRKSGPKTITRTLD